MGNPSQLSYPTNLSAGIQAQNSYFATWLVYFLILVFVRFTKILVQLAAKKASKKSHVSSKRNNEWAEEDVTDYGLEEFDFQANLNRFDKKKVFAEIKVCLSSLRDW